MALRTDLLSREIPPTDAHALLADLRNKPYRCALPASLPDQWVIPLVRDLRQIECMTKGFGGPHPKMTAALMLAMHVIAGRMSERELALDFALSEEQLVNWFQMYQYYIEREMVARLVGVRVADDEQSLARAIDHQIDTMRSRAT